MAYGPKIGYQGSYHKSSVVDPPLPLTPKVSLPKSNIVDHAEVMKDVFASYIISRSYKVDCTKPKASGEKTLAPVRFLIWSNFIFKRIVCCTHR